MLGGGVHNFYKIKVNNNKRIRDLGKIIRLNQLKNKRIAIDANNVLYEILSAANKVNKPELFDLILRNKINKYNKLGIDQVWVFDHPKSNPLRLDKKIDICDENIIKKVQLNKANILRAQEIIDEFNFKVTKVIAKYKLEAEQVCAILTRKPIKVDNKQIDIVDYVITCDSDALVFGSKNILVRTNKINVYKMYVLKDILHISGLNRKQLAIISVILGTDFNKGIKGIGPSKVINIVKENDYKLNNRQKKIIKYYLSN